MQTIQVTHDFVLNLEDGTQRTFRAGVEQVDDATATHWFVKANSEPAGGPEVQTPKAQEAQTPAAARPVTDAQLQRGLEQAVKEAEQAVAAARKKALK
jgi:hypothetical protein